MERTVKTNEFLRRPTPRVQQTVPTGQACKQKLEQAGQCLCQEPVGKNHKRLSRSRRHCDRAGIRRLPLLLSNIETGPVPVSFVFWHQCSELLETTADPNEMPRPRISFLLFQLEEPVDVAGLGLSAKRWEVYLAKPGSLPQTEVRYEVCVHGIFSPKTDEPKWKDPFPVISGYSRCCGIILPDSATGRTIVVRIMPTRAAVLKPD